MYSLVVRIRRETNETYKIKVVADDEEEAQDLAYEYFDGHFNSEFTPNSVLKVGDETQVITVENVEFERTPVEKVFKDDSA